MPVSLFDKVCKKRGYLFRQPLYLRIINYLSHQTLPSFVSPPEIFPTAA